MKRRNFRNNVGLLMGVLLLAHGFSVCGQQGSPPQTDIVGGAAFLLEGRPPNPKPRNGAARSETASDPSSKTDNVEDALALGNSLRDRKPPDLKSAERAYRLGIKLSPRDPRPYTGLGNVLYDQKRYAEAAETYREALRLSAPQNGAGAFVRRSRPDSRLEISVSGRRELRLDLVLILMQQNDYPAAESELRKGTRLDFLEPSWLAALGSVLYLQGQFAEAADYFEQAGKADPEDARYHELRKESLAKSASALAVDGEVSRALTLTEWRVSSLQNGICRLERDGALRCDNSGRPFHEQMSWRIKEGLLDLFTRTGPATSDRCTGTMQADQIRMKCLMGNTLVQEIWTRKTN